MGEFIRQQNFVFFHHFFLAGALNVGAKDVLVGDSCRDSLLKNISSDDEQLPLLSAIGSQKR